MLLIQPPRDQEPSASAPNAEATIGTSERPLSPPPIASSPASHVESSDFDDIETVLANQPQGGRAAAEARAKAAVTAQAKRARSLPSAMPAARPPVSSVAHAKPPLSEGGSLSTHQLDQWTSPAQKQRQRLILIAAASVFAIVAIAIIVIYSMRGSQPGSVALNSQDRETVANPGEEQLNSATDDDPTETNVGALDDKPPQGTAHNDINNDGPTVEGPIGLDVPLDSDAAIADRAPGSDIVEQSTPIEQRLPDQVAPIASSRLFGDFLKGFAPTTRDDDLTVVLGRLQTNINDLRIVVSRAVPADQIGVAPYYIERIEPRAPAEDLDTLLAIRLAAVEYRDIATLAIIRDIALMLNLPISIDDSAIDMPGVDWMAPVTIIRDQLTVGDLLQDIADQMHLEVVPGRHGLVLRRPGMDEPVTQQYALPPLSNPSPESYSRFAEAIKLLIEPGTWGDGPQPSEADPLAAMLSGLGANEQDEAEGDDSGDQEALDDALPDNLLDNVFSNGEVHVVDQQLVVTHTRRTQAQVSRFLDQLIAAHTVMSSAADPSAAAQLETHWHRFAPQLTLPIQMPPAIEAPLDLYLQRLTRASGVLIVVEWEALYDAGWSMQTVVPSSLRASDLDTLFRDLEQSAGFVISAQSAQVAKLTTTADLMRRMQLEVYPVGHILARGVTAEQLEELLWRVIAWHWQQGKGRFLVYEPNYQCLIVSAPQRLQRQIEAIVDYLSRE